MAMAKLFWSLLIVLSAAGAARAGEITCQVNGIYSRMNIRWDEKTVDVLVVNPRGFDWMPQMEAPFALRDLGLLKAQSDQLQGLGSEFEYAWKRESCEFSKDDGWLISCHAPVNAVGKDNGVQAALFTTARIDEKSLSGAQSTLRLRFIFSNGGMYFVAIPFPLQACLLKP